MTQSWELKKNPADIDISELSDFFKINRNLLKIIISRKIITRSEIRDFINPHIGALYSPFLMNGMQDAVSLIRKALIEKKVIGLFSDSDLDGITSLKILHYLFKKIGTEIHYRYPRNDETYGLTKRIIDELHENGVGLLITSDSGIRDLDEIFYARSLGIDVIVTDHHEQGDILPDAIIINPKKDICNYPDKNLAGVGVVFKLCHALLMSYIPVYDKKFILISLDDGKLYYSIVVNLIIIDSGCTQDIDSIIKKYNNENPVIISMNISDNDSPELLKNPMHNDLLQFMSSNLDEFRIIKNKTIPSACKFLGIEESFFTGSIKLLERIFISVQMRASGKIYDFLNYCMEFVAIGTVADVMPLIGENRIFTKLGLERMSNSSHNGISILSESKSVDSKFISWELSPILNSPGRYGKTDITVDFFLEEDDGKGRNIIDELRILNDDRKKLISDTFTEIISGKNEKNIIIFNSLVCAKTDKIPDGMTGLLASKLSEYYSKPAITVSISGDINGQCRGSGRCNGSYDFFLMAEKVSDKFIRFGGHSQAFGFTIAYDRIDEMLNELSLLINNEEYSDLNRRIFIDDELNLSEINTKLIKSLKILEPFGKGNEEPVFLTKNIKPYSFTRFGKKQNHGKFLFKNESNLTAIGWGMADIMEPLFESSEAIDIVYRLENNEYNNKTYPRIIISSIQSGS
jgi:single-stranded-DNA-specific exonuclease